ncbi:MAG: hypothetical protein LQ352_003969 [Teloschistes flavicans]|nr:MAG: hypothetical protein LQ352_003969 [Teloschistes flavicans]
MPLLSFAQGETSQPTASTGGTALELTDVQSSRVGADGLAQGQQNARRYQPPPVHASRIVQKPIPRLQKEDPREFQIRQLGRRFSAQETVGDGGSILKFRLVPSDPDFPFELIGLECLLHVPKTFPGNAGPSLAVKNADMPRGYQINVERGFDTLVQKLPQATLLALVNALDKQLEAFLTQEKAETIKLVPNTTRAAHALRESVRGKVREDPVQTHVVEKPRKDELPSTPDQRHAAEARRQVETRQLEARLGRLPLFSKSPDGIAFNIPISPGRPDEMPVPLQAVKSLTLYVPTLYPLECCRIELHGVSRESAGKVERGFGIRTRDNTNLSLMAHINYLAQNLHTMAITPEEESKPIEQSVPTTEELRMSEKEHSHRLIDEDGEEDRTHIKFIPRPPEWTTAGEEESDSDNDYSDSYDSGDESEDHDKEHNAAESVTQSASSQSAERGISLSLPSLELHGIELLELASLSVSVKCSRCKTTSDISNLRPSTDRQSSCTKCAQQFSLTFRQEIMHANSFRAGYLDLTGCTIADMLPSPFIPTCSTCSTPVPAPGVVSVRGDAASIAICRECHARLSFKIPETKFMLISNASLHPRHLLPLRRKQPKENLGIVAGQELPRRGRCRHYAKSYRWFRFSCCAKVYACDKCHDEAEAHPNEHANRMLCGWCSREQNYRPEDCAICKASVVGKKGSGFWEGGKGTRDKNRMSRKDPRKYKRRPGTRVSGGLTRGGIGGGGETAKKNT